jgi:hypothetical protein
MASLGIPGLRKPDRCHKISGVTSGKHVRILSWLSGEIGGTAALLVISRVATRCHDLGASPYIASYTRRSPPHHNVLLHHTLLNSSFLFSSSIPLDILPSVYTRHGLTTDDNHRWLRPVDFIVKKAFVLHVVRTPCFLDTSDISQTTQTPLNIQNNQNT